MGEKILSATSSFAMGFSMMASGIAKLVTKGDANNTRINWWSSYFYRN